MSLIDGSEVQKEEEANGNGNMNATCWGVIRAAYSIDSEQRYTVYIASHSAPLGGGILAGGMAAEQVEESTR
jgi:hypothetical protein